MIMKADSINSVTFLDSTWSVVRSEAQGAPYVSYATHMLSSVDAASRLTFLSRPIFENFSHGRVSQ